MTGTVTALTNPAARDRRSAHVRAAALHRLRERGFVVTEIAGDSPAESSELAARAVADGTDALVVIGGDGLVFLAWQAAAGTGIPLGIVPAGTGNDHARALGIPTDPVAAADVIVGGRTRTIDLGRATPVGLRPLWFGTVLASGFDSLVTDRANRMRWPRGHLRYNAATVAELANLRLLPYRITLDGNTFDTEATMVSVGNASSYGGGMRIAPNARLDDGLFDVVVVTSASRSRLLRLFPRVYRGTHVDLDEVTVYRARSVRLDCPGITAYADGERVGPLPVDIEAMPDAGCVFVP
ncbi:diacylglycerol kinase [Rhodococcus sp. CX]|uniref:diacylglycerol kinase n=1 Tax=Rhodococcus sp. CX TaxID=2789880 RepID=UPI0018CFC9CA|nr:diacylglycerol kinase [Rhodococcus sp. CX]MBH0120667.1 diacylglycerol kinase [Rhodococcus sp. CX]